MAFAICFFSFTSLIPIDFCKNVDSVYETQEAIISLNCMIFLEFNDKLLESK